MSRKFFCLFFDNFLKKFHQKGFKIAILEIFLSLFWLQNKSQKPYSSGFQRNVSPNIGLNKKYVPLEAI